MKEGGLIFILLPTRRKFNSSTSNIHSHRNPHEFLAEGTMNQIRKRIAKYKLKCPSRVPFSSPIFTSFPLRLSTISTHPLRLLSTTATNANVSYHRERKNGAGPSSRIKDRANLHSANVAATPCSLLPQDGRSLSRITSDACALFFSPESRTNQPPRPVFFVLCFFFFFFFDFLSKQIRANDLL